MRTGESVRVGIPVSLSGQFRQQGRQVLLGLRAWAEDVNRSGGMLVGGAAAPAPVTLVHYDDASSVDRVKAVTRQLVQREGVDLLMGPYSSVLAKAAIEVAEEHGQVMWNHGGASEDIYEGGYRGVVGILTPPSQYLTALPEVLEKVRPEARRLALVRAIPGEFPEAVSRGVQQRGEALGWETVLVREYDAAKPDWNAIVTEVAEADPDLLVGVGRIGNDVALARRLARSRVSVGAVAVVAAGIKRFRDDLGVHAEGILGPSQWEPGSAEPVNVGPTEQAVLESLRRHLGEDQPVDYPMVQSYAAGLVAQRCVEEAGSLDPAEVRSAAGKLEFTTFYGRFRIDSATGRQVGRSVMLVQWQGERKVVVWPPERAEGVLVYPWR